MQFDCKMYYSSKLNEIWYFFSCSYYFFNVKPSILRLIEFVLFPLGFKLCTLECIYFNNCISAYKDNPEYFWDVVIIIFKKNYTTYSIMCFL